MSDSLVFILPGSNVLVQPTPLFLCDECHQPRWPLLFREATWRLLCASCVTRTTL